MKLRKVLTAATVAVAALFAAGTGQAAPFADIVVLMDESGSMSGEQAWIGGAMTALNTDLIGAGLSPNNFGSVGFSVGGGPGLTRYFNVPGPGTSNTVAGLTSQFGTAAQYNAITGSYSIGGGTEDGWAAITAANLLTFRANAARNYILVTDEDRDASQAGLTFNSVRDSMTATNTLLNAIVNVTFRCGNITANVIGVSSNGTCYIADGSGGYTTGSGGVAVSGAGTSIANYVDLAWATGGAAWNLNLLRAGGLLAQSFSEAFVDIKVAEIINPAPEPSTLALLGLGLAGLAAARRRKAK